MAAVASRVRKGEFTLKGPNDTAALVFHCSPTAVALVPEAGDAGDDLEVLCGDLIKGDPGKTAWTCQITSVQDLESASTDQTSLALWALKNDGLKADFTFKPSPTTKTFYGTVTVVAIQIGGEVGGTAPTSDAEWPMDAAPTDTAPTQTLTAQTEKAA